MQKITYFPFSSSFTPRRSSLFLDFVDDDAESTDFNWKLKSKEQYLLGGKSCMHDYNSYMLHCKPPFLFLRNGRDSWLKRRHFFQFFLHLFLDARRQNTVIEYSVLFSRVSDFSISFSCSAFQFFISCPSFRWYFSY
jgi:hypothetical protein